MDWTEKNYFYFCWWQTFLITFILNCIIKNLSRYSYQRFELGPNLHKISTKHLINDSWYCQLARVMINCSIFVCSKKLVDTIFHLLNTIRANVTFFCQLVENQKSSAVRVFRAVSLLDKKILTARIVTGWQRFWKMSTARHNL